MNSGKEAPKRELPTDIISQFLENQKGEIEVRRQEINLTSKQDDNQKEIAIHSIRAQQSDFQNERNHKFKSSIASKIFIFALVLAGLSFIIYAFHNGKDEIAMEVVKMAGIAIISGTGGFYYGKSKTGD